MKSLNITSLKVNPPEQWMGGQILNNQNSLSSSCLDTPSLAQPCPVLPLFCKVVLISDDGESQCFGRVMWSCSSLSHDRRTDGFLPLGLSGKLPHKAQSHFHSVPLIFLCVLHWCSAEMSWNQSDRTGVSAQTHGTVLACAQQAVEVAQLCITVQTRAISVPEKEKKTPWDAFSLSSIGKKLWPGEVLWFPWFCDKQQQEKENLSLLACSFSLCLVVRAALCYESACPHLKFHLGGA